jgi:hypothetical protein
MSRPGATPELCQMCLQATTLSLWEMPFKHHERRINSAIIHLGIVTVY